MIQSKGSTFDKLFSWFSISFLRTPSCLTTDWLRRTSLWPLVWPVTPPGRHQLMRGSCLCWTFPSCSPPSCWVRWPYEPCHMTQVTMWPDHKNPVRWPGEPCQVTMRTLSGDHKDPVRWLREPFQVTIRTLLGDHLNVTKWTLDCRYLDFQRHFWDSDFECTPRLTTFCALWI